MDARQRQQLVFLAARDNVLADERLRLLEPLGREQRQARTENLPSSCIAIAYCGEASKVLDTRLGILVIFLQILLVAIRQHKLDLLAGIIAILLLR